MYQVPRVFAQEPWALKISRNAEAEVWWNSIKEISDRSRSTISREPYRSGCILTKSMPTTCGSGSACFNFPKTHLHAYFNITVFAIRPSVSAQSGTLPNNGKLTQPCQLPIYLCQFPDLIYEEVHDLASTALYVTRPHVRLEKVCGICPADLSLAAVGKRSVRLSLYWGCGCKCTSSHGYM